MTNTAEFPTPRHASRPDLEARSALGVLLACTALVLALHLPTATAGEAAARPAVAITDFALRRSHNGLYRGEMAAAAVNSAEPHEWLVRLEQRNHRRLAHAKVHARLWMPESDIEAPTQPTVTYLGDGNYRLDNVLLPQSGWWNLALVVDARAGVDSLAFNLRAP